MKDNTSQAKAHLNEALRSLPQDFALSDARYYIRHALNKIEHVEKKRGKRAAAAAEITAQQEWQDQLNKNTVNPLNARQTIHALEQMVADEHTKLESLRNKKSDGGLLTD